VVWPHAPKSPDHVDAVAAFSTAGGKAELSIGCRGCASSAVPLSGIILDGRQQTAIDFLFARWQPGTIDDRTRRRVSNVVSASRNINFIAKISYALSE